MKGRKGKKGSKNSKNNVNNSVHAQQAQPPPHTQGQGGHQSRYDPPLDGTNDFDPNGEEYYDDEYDDGYDDMADLEPVDSPSARTEHPADGYWKPPGDGLKGSAIVAGDGDRGGT